MTVRRTINPNPALTFPAMSQAVLAAGILHVSGQVALDSQGGLVGEGDPDAQAEQCMTNLEAVLAAAGGGLADVVKLTCFLTDAATYPSYARAKAARFRIDPPAGTAVVVSALLDPRFLLEVEAVAVLGPPA